MLYLVADLLAIQWCGRPTGNTGVCCIWWPTYWQYRGMLYPEADLLAIQGYAVSGGRPTGTVQLGVHAVSDGRPAGSTVCGGYVLCPVADLLAVQSVGGKCCIWWPTYWQYCIWWPTYWQYSWWGVNAVSGGQPTGSTVVEGYMLYLVTDLLAVQSGGGGGG